MHLDASAHCTETGIVLGNYIFGLNPGFALGSLHCNLAPVTANGFVAIAQAGICVYSPKMCGAGDGSAAGTGDRITQLPGFFLH